jgi:hypothetical protein
VFVKITKEYHMIIVVYVDDFIVCSSSTSATKALVEVLNRKFHMKHLGEVSLILGIKVERTESTLKLTQAHYAEETLRRFGMWECNPSRNPLWKGVKLDKFDPEDEDTEFPFKQALGSIQWMAKTTRPDLCTTANKLACFQEHPKKLHEQGIKSAMRYIKGHLENGLTYYKDNKDPMYGICDATWKSETNSRSRRGMVLMRGGAAVVWDSKIIPRACLSSTGSEYISGTETTKDVVYYRELMNEVGWTIDKPTLLQIDNMAAIHMAQDAASHKKTQHLLVREMFISQEVENGTVRVEKIHTDENSSDHFTKILTNEVFEKHRATYMGKPNNRQFHLSTKVVK